MEWQCRCQHFVKQFPRSVSIAPAADVIPVVVLALDRNDATLILDVLGLFSDNAHRSFVTTISSGVGTMGVAPTTLAATLAAGWQRGSFVESLPQNHRKVKTRVRAGLPPHTAGSCHRSPFPSAQYTRNGSKNRHIIAIPRRKSPSALTFVGQFLLHATDKELDAVHQIVLDFIAAKAQASGFTSRILPVTAFCIRLVLDR